MQTLSNMVELLLGHELPDSTGDVTGMNLLGVNDGEGGGGGMTAAMFGGGSSVGTADAGFASRFAPSPPPAAAGSPNKGGVRLTSTALSSLGGKASPKLSTKPGGDNNNAAYQPQRSSQRPVWIGGGPFLSSFTISPTTAPVSQFPSTNTPFVQAVVPGSSSYYANLTYALCRHT